MVKGRPSIIDNKTPQFMKDDWWPYGNLQPHLQQAEIVLDGQLFLPDTGYRGTVQTILSDSFEFRAEHLTSMLPMPTEVLRDFEGERQPTIEAVICGSRLLLQRAAVESDYRTKAVYAMMSTAFQSMYYALRTANALDELEDLYVTPDGEGVVPSPQSDAEWFNKLTNGCLRRVISSSTEYEDMRDDRGHGPKLDSAVARGDVAVLQDDHLFSHQTRELNRYIGALALPAGKRPEVFARPLTANMAESLDSETIRDLVSNIENRSGFAHFFQKAFDQVAQRLGKVTSAGFAKKGEQMTTFELEMVKYQIASNTVTVLETLFGEIPHDESVEVLDSSDVANERFHQRMQRSSQSAPRGFRVVNPKDRTGTRRKPLTNNQKKKRRKDAKKTRKKNRR